VQPAYEEAMTNSSKAVIVTPRLARLGIEDVDSRKLTILREAFGVKPLVTLHKHSSLQRETLLQR